MSLWDSLGRCRLEVSAVPGSRSTTNWEPPWPEGGTQGVESLWK